MTDHEYSTPLQAHLFACLLNDVTAFQTCRPILSATYFDDQLARAVRYALKYSDDTGKPPPIALVQAATGTQLTKLPSELTCEPAWLISTIEQFCRDRAVENVVLDGIDLNREGKATLIADRMNEALAISINQQQEFQKMPLRGLLLGTIPAWLIPGLIYHQQVMMIYGPPDSFKSFVILHLASLLAHGMEWNGHKLKPRPVLYVAAEGAPMMGKRRKAWFLHYNLPLENDNLDVIGEPIRLLDPAHVRRFINAQKRDQWQGGLVVIDTVSKCVPGACESDVEVMSQVIASADLIAKELDCAVILVHHTGWDGAHARGSSASLGNCDGVARIDRKSDHHAILKVEKQKDAQRETFEFVLNQVALGLADGFGDEITSLCAMEASADDMAEYDAMTARSDRMSIATAMNCDQMPQSSLVALMEKVLGVGDKQARRRIIAALPEQWTKTRSGTDLVELRRVVINSKMALIERRVAG